MTDGNDNGIELTRRRALAGLGTVGVASAGAGLGTTALFSDTESFDGNSLMAGTLDLAVSADVKGQSAELPDPEVESPDGPDDSANGNTVTITISDMKPGDWFVLEWHAEVYGNPGYVQVTSVDDDFVNDEGENPESETDTAGQGDLGDALLSTVWLDWTGGSSRSSLEDLDETTNNVPTPQPVYEMPNLDGVTPTGAHYTTLNEAHQVYKSGVLLRDPSSGDPLEVGKMTDGESAVFYQLFELPLDVGNDVQGDKVRFTLRFDAQQVRNNPTPFDSS